MTSASSALSFWGRLRWPPCLRNAVHGGLENGTSPCPSDGIAVGRGAAVTSSHGQRDTWSCPAVTTPGVHRTAGSAPSCPSPAAGQGHAALRFVRDSFGVTWEAPSSGILPVPPCFRSHCTFSPLHPGSVSPQSCDSRLL